MSQENVGLNKEIAVYFLFERASFKHGKVKLRGIFIVDLKEKVFKFIFYKGKQQDDCRL